MAVDCIVYMYIILLCGERYLARLNYMKGQSFINQTGCYKIKYVVQSSIASLVTFYLDQKRLFAKVDIEFDESTRSIANQSFVK